MTILDPEEGVPYAECGTCGKTFASREEMHIHLNETMKASEEKRSHRAFIKNPSREERIQREIRTIVDDAIMHAADTVYTDLVRHDGATEEEVTEAMKGVFTTDIQDEWREYLRENS